MFLSWGGAQLVGRHFGFPVSPVGEVLSVVIPVTLGLPITYVTFLMYFLLRARSHELGDVNAKLAAANAQLTASNQKLSDSNQQLSDALGQVKELNGLIPICFSCKKVRNDAEQWERIDAYITRRSKAAFTHGLCPDCVVKMEAEADEVMRRAR